MQIAVWIIAFIGSLYVLVKSADHFTEYSEKLGLLFGMSSFIIGATIVAVGTSLPELVSSLYAVIGTGQTTFVIDNVIGSNIANALLILGIGALAARTLKVSTSLIDIDLPFFVTSAGLLLFFAMDKVVTWQEGIFLFLFFVIFMVYNITSKPEKKDADEMEAIKEEYDGEGSRIKILKIVKYSGLIILSMGLIAVSAKYFIDSLLTLSDLFGISSSVLTISVVAIGTSLPEILTSLSAIKLGNHGMAIGNVFGSNIFNIALVTSIPAFFGNLDIDPTTFAIGLPFLALATFTAFAVTADNKVRLWEGVMMLLIYLVFMAKILGLI
ncbi:calcium/sodium antiporter [Candidatus Nomurabacteria bacterium]|nr:calcium/sodium antiporter [Candidatus Nomurabacteria bacterium]